MRHSGKLFASNSARSHVESWDLSILIVVASMCFSIPTISILLTVWCTSDAIACCTLLRAKSNILCFGVGLGTSSNTEFMKEADFLRANVEWATHDLIVEPDFFRPVLITDVDLLNPFFINRPDFFTPLLILGDVTMATAQTI